MGHPSSEVIKHVLPFSVNKITEDLPCDTCAQLKQHKILFPSINSCSEKSLELMHLDLWGTYHEKSLSGA